MTEQKDPIFDFAAHVVDTSFDDIPAPAIAAAKTFILDTLGVGISGSNGPDAAALVSRMQQTNPGNDARCWVGGARMNASAAALCNAYQAHCQEYDCVHEPAVAHVVSIVLPAALAWAERDGNVSGRQLIEAVVLGVDVAAGLGVAAGSGLRFFRPATAGAFGGAAALGKLMGFDQAQMVQAFSLAYGQVSGTMQAHTEGSGLLALQMGFNARNAIMAAELAQAGMTGPENILSGDFGYFTLIEDGGDPAAVTKDLGKVWRITEVAHKPFPSGRATHGILDGCLSLQREHSFTASDVAKVDLTVPPLIEHLVGRPPKTEMMINYARLCARYVLACALHSGGVALADFSPEAYKRADRQDLARRTTITVQDDGDPNALVPIGITITLADGTRLTQTVRDVYGSPANPMSHDAHLEKFRQNCRDAVHPLPDDQAQALIDAVDALEDLPEATRLVDLSIA